MIVMMIIINSSNSILNNILKDKMVQELIDKEGFSIEPIIKTDENDNQKWNRELTDRYLVNHDYGWICYIKLYNFKPFIGGKTGTRAISDSPIDFDFRVFNEEDLNDSRYNGLGRTFVKLNEPGRMYTDNDYILVKKCNSEIESFEVERYLLNKYELFSS